MFPCSLVTGCLSQGQKFKQTETIPSSSYNGMSRACPLVPAVEVGVAWRVGCRSPARDTHLHTGLPQTCWPHTPEALIRSHCLNQHWLCWRGQGAAFMWLPGTLQSWTRPTAVARDTGGRDKMLIISLGLCSLDRKSVV